MRNRVSCGLALALLVVACSAQGGIRVTLDEYMVSLGRTTEQPGEVTFTATNAGSIAHQLLVLRTERDADELPVRKGVVTLGAEGIDVEGEIPIVAKGDSNTLSLSLRPGDYVLMCNIASHYENGMWASLRVTP